MSTHEPALLTEILQWRGLNQPHTVAFRFLTDGEYDEITWTYKDLDRRARAIAAMLQACSKAGDRALLLYPPGLDFISAYLGCLYAGVIAIPIYPPHPVRIEKALPNILRIAADASPSVGLLTNSLLDIIHSRNEVNTALKNIRLLATDNDQIDEWESHWQHPGTTGDDIAFLQYTSGSTSTPKGVMVTHNNLIHNLGLIAKSFNESSENNAVVWLPPYHDMGLIGGILQPLYSGFPVTLMPHMIFLQRPYRWLQAISRFRATASSGPNFAYDLCVKKIRPEQRAQLDLSRLEVAFCGAEPVHYKTLEQFAEYFAPCGFRREAFLPCYGLAEATLMVTGGPSSRAPKKLNLVNAALEKHKAIVASGVNGGTRVIVSCGRSPADSQEIRIVNPDTLTPCLESDVGEIWVSGPSVAKGYWNNPAESALTFGARLPNGGNKTFLRTGDLGFLRDGELYITGRLKNLIIADGRNHYPHDIERTVENAHPAIRPAGCAAFSINNESGENIVVIAEVEHLLAFSADVVKTAIRTAVSAHHELRVHDIRLSIPGGIPRTTSGKIRHHLCKSNYITGTLKEITLT